MNASIVLARVAKNPRIAKVSMHPIRTNKPLSTPSFDAFEFSKLSNMMLIKAITIMALVRRNKGKIGNNVKTGISMRYNDSAMKL